jgi:hypothetical protein
MLPDDWPLPHFEVPEPAEREQELEIQLRSDKRPIRAHMSVRVVFAAVSSIQYDCLAQQNSPSAPLHYTGLLLPSPAPYSYFQAAR